MASIYSSSPPTCVQARPVAMPISLHLPLLFGQALGNAEVFVDIALGYFMLVLIAFGHCAGDLAADRADFALEVAQPGLGRVLMHNGKNGLIGNLYILLGYAVFLHLPRDDELPGDFELFLVRVARKLDNLHAVLQGAA